MEHDGVPSTVTPPPAVTLTFDLLTPQSNQHICEPKYICDQNWVKFPSLVFEIWCPEGFQTHSRTDTPENSVPQAPAPKVFGGGDIISNNNHISVWINGILAYSTLWDRRAARQQYVTYFGGTINIFNAEDWTQAVQQNFCERWYQLRRRYQHVDTRWSEQTRIAHISHSTAVTPVLRSFKQQSKK